MRTVPEVRSRLVRPSGRDAPAGRAELRLWEVHDVQRLLGQVAAEGEENGKRTTARSEGRNMTKVFPCVLIALDVAAAVVYAACGDWRRLIYWLAAATLTATVTF